MPSLVKRQLGCFIVLFLFVAVGCGKSQLPTYKVNGQLKFEDGTTPAFGNIEFFNAENKINAHGKINRDGTFTVTTYDKNDGAVAGKHQIVIIQLTGNYLTAKSNQDIQHDHGQLAHPRYVDYRTSGLECTITEGENDVTLVLEKNPNQTEDGLPLD